MTVTEGTPFEDATGAYEIYGVGTLNLKFANYDWLVYGLEYFRKIIRAIVTLLLILFHVRMYLSFIDQDSGTVAGKAGSDSDKKGGK